MKKSEATGTKEKDEKRFKAGALTTAQIYRLTMRGSEDRRVG